MAIADYAYSKTYDGGGDTSVSSAGGTFGSDVQGVSTLDTAKASVRGADEHNSVERKLQEPDNGWAIGTLIYYKWPDEDGWWWGTITAYSDDEYTTTWSDGNVEVFIDITIVDQMVQDAEEEAWDVGTVLYYKWPEAEGWYWGTITAYDNGAYTTVWSDADEEVFTDLDVVNQMVEDADDQAWDVGTALYYKVRGYDGWWWGTITAYDNGAYTTVWSGNKGQEVFTDFDVVAQMVQNADDEAWDIGTVIYYNWPEADGWYWGMITAYDNGAYTTVWSDKDEKVFTDFDVVDQMVEDADDKAWDVGTVIYYKWPEAEGWYWGTITAYDNGVYTTVWSDVDEEVFTDLDVVDQMVEDADDEAWDVGTVIYYKWPGNDDWWWGTITAYENGAYTIVWSDKDEKVFTDRDVVDQMVEDAENQAWDVGTVIYYKWPEADGWHWGTITAYDNGAYTTVWSDKDEEVFTDRDVVDQMVEDAEDKAWDVGTVIYYKRPEAEGWYWGTITAYDNGAYTTVWSDEDVKVFTDITIVDQMVEDADDEAWDVGTLIYNKRPGFDDWRWGTITAYENGAYTTTWSDGDVEVFTDIVVVDQMVQNANEKGDGEAIQESDGARSADANLTNKSGVMIGSVILVALIDYV